MRIEVKTQAMENENIVDTILKNRGLDREWLVAGEEYLLDGRVFRNFDKAWELLKANLSKRIAIYVDSDTDGFCSSAIMYQWLKNKYGVEAEVIIPEGKVHGILSNLIHHDIDLLIVPDASSSEAKIHKALMNIGVEILVLDHHEFDLSNGEFATIINPQHPDCPYENKNISGTGVVYKFIEGVDKNEGVDYHSEYIDLAAIATVADVMDMSTMDNKALINIGLSKVENPYFKEYHKYDARINEKVIDPIVVGFYMVPPINALIRIGGLEQKQMLFDAIVGNIPAATMVAGVGSIRDKQNRDKEPLITRIAMNLNQVEGSKDHAVIMTTAPFNTPKAMTGLIAGQMTSAYLRPVFLGQIKDGKLTGSARNVNNSNIENLRDFCLDSGLFDWAAGHKSAFGWQIPEENVDKFLKYCDDNLPKYEAVYFADFQLKGDKNQLISDSYELAEHAGPGFPQIVVYDEIVVAPSQITLMGARKTTLKLVVGGVEYIAFNFKGELPLDVSTWKIVGKPSLNEFRGNITPQVKMDGWVIEPFDL